MKQNPNTIVVDTGNNAYTKPLAKLFLDATLQMGYSAVGVGHSEAGIGDDYPLPANNAGVIVVAPELNMRKGTAPYLIKSIAGIKVGITAFNETAEKLDVFTAHKQQYEAYAAARKESDLLIILDQSGQITADWLGRIGKRFGEPDVVISGTVNSDLPSAKIVKKTCFLKTSVKGSAVGVAKVQLMKGDSPFVQMNMIELRSEVVEDQQIAKMVADYTKGQLVPAGRTVSSLPPSAGDAYPHPENCKTCHRYQYDMWSTTKHASGLRILVNTRKNIPECLKCHSESYRRQGWFNEIKEGEPAGVECLSCHTNFTPHGRDYRGEDNKLVEPKTCKNCHDIMHSPNYDVKTYWTRIVHKDRQGVLPVTSHTGN